MSKLARVGEFAFIDAVDRLCRRYGSSKGVRLGIGDDAAVLDLASASLVSTDTLLEGVHFETAWLTPSRLGFRAFRVAVSDLAAMGATPRYALLSLCLPPAYDSRRALGLVRGFVREAAQSSTVLVGGNVSRAATLGITVTVMGTGEGRGCRRSGARPGQRLLVTGNLGDAAAGVELLAGGKQRGVLVERYRRPPLRVATARSLAQAGSVRAMIDVSDGLVQDLEHLCRASAVQAEIAPQRLPTSVALRRASKAPENGARKRMSALGRPAHWYALYGGEDYELLFTVDDDDRTVARVASICRGYGCSVAEIGRIHAGRDARVVDSRGRILRGGFDHFGGSR